MHKTTGKPAKLNESFAGFYVESMKLPAQQGDGIVDVADFNRGRSLCFLTIQGPLDIG